VVVKGFFYEVLLFPKTDVRNFFFSIKAAFWGLQGGVSSPHLPLPKFNQGTSSTFSIWSCRRLQSKAQGHQKSG
jgi:hypothetical protein